VDAKPKPMPSDSGHNAEETLGHVVDVRVLLAVFAALVVLAAITVAVSYFNFGALNLLVAMGVATIKAALVALYFMHLRYDSRFNAFIFCVGVAFLGLFLVITMLDTIEYYPYVQQWQQSHP
jgi:cytochrome c oxidase subunit 4